MYHPYLADEAKRVMKDRRKSADAARLVSQARAASPSLMSRIGARLRILLSGLINGADKPQQHTQKVSSLLKSSME